MVPSLSRPVGSLKDWFRMKSIGDQIVVGLVTTVILTGCIALATLAWNAVLGGPEPLTATAVTFYEPFEQVGQLNVRVSSTEPGQCFRNTYATERMEARRCFGDKSFVHDPCFSREAFVYDGLVVCPDDPWSRSAVVIEPVRDELGLLEGRGGGARPPAAPVDYRGPTSIQDLGPGRSVWALELANGEKCTKIKGGTHTPLAGFAQSFDCRDGGTVVGGLNDSSPVWIANYFPPGSGEGRLERIRSVWL